MKRIIGRIMWGRVSLRWNDLAAENTPHHTSYVNSLTAAATVVSSVFPRPSGRKSPRTFMGEARDRVGTLWSFEPTKENGHGKCTIRVPGLRVIENEMWEHALDGTGLRRGCFLVMDLIGEVTQPIEFAEIELLRFQWNLKVRHFPIV